MYVWCKHRSPVNKSIIVDIYVCIDQAEDNYNLDRFWISYPTSSYRSLGRVHIFVVNVLSTLKLVVSPAIVKNKTLWIRRAT